MSFPAAPLDRPTRLLTFALVLAIGLLLPAVMIATSAPEARTATAVVLGFGAGVLILAAWAMAPSRYELDGATLRVHRRLLPARVYRLRGRAQRAPATLGVGLRFGGSGGMFGWSGSFWKPGLGRYRAHLTDRSRIVACDTDAGLVAISPAEPERFCEATRRVR